MTILYHLHVHGKYLPAVKQFYNTRQDAVDDFLSIIDQYFNFHKVKSYICVPDKHRWDAYCHVLDMGHTIRVVETTGGPHYKRLLLIQEPTTNEVLRDEIIENSDGIGGVTPFICIKGDW